MTLEVYAIGYSTLMIAKLLAKLRVLSFLLSLLLTHYSRCCLSIPLENIKKPKGFLIFSGGIDNQH